MCIRDRYRIGGFDALHEKVPAVMFNLFGGDVASEYTWYSIAALLLVQLIGIAGSQHHMAISGSAKDEMAARLGAVTGRCSPRIAPPSARMTARSMAFRSSRTLPGQW